MVFFLSISFENLKVTGLNYTGLRGSTVCTYKVGGPRLGLFCVVVVSYTTRVHRSECFHVYVNGYEEARINPTTVWKLGLDGCELS